MRNKQKILIYLACILLFSAVGNALAQGQAWEDDFESYTVGSAPTSNWHLSGNTSSIIVNDISFTGSKSLRTYGSIGGCWAGLLSRPLGTSFPLTIEVTVRNGSENLSGCHPYRASVELKPGPNWQDVPGATPFWFKENGDFEITWDPPYQSFPGYALNEWHHIRVELSAPGDGLLHARYWIDQDYLGEFTRTWGTWMSDLTHLMIGSQEGTAWFDDVKVISEVGGLPLDVWQDGNGHLWVENAFYKWDVTHGSSLIIKEGETWRDWRSIYNQQYHLVLGRNSPGTGGTQGGTLEMSDLTVVSINNDGQVATVELTGTFSRENRQATLVFTFSGNSGLVKLQGQITNVPTTPNPSGLNTSFSLVPGGDVTGVDDFYHYSGQATESGFPYGTGVHIPRANFLPVGQTDYAYITDYDKSHCQGFAIITELSKTTDFITDINYGIAQIWDTHHYCNWSNMSISPNATGPFTLFFYFYETDSVVAYQPVEDLINSGTLDGKGPGSVSGTVSDCVGGVLGVAVDLFDSTGSLAEFTYTDISGFFEFDSVDPGDYTVSIVTPLGYVADFESRPVTVTPNADSVVNFTLHRLEIVPSQRSMGYWKHQVNVHLSGRGHAQESLADMSNYMSLVAEHFNNNLANPITIFEVPQPATQTDSLEVLQDLLTVDANGTMNDRAKQQLIALILNVVSLKLHQTTSISEDSATVSQAITYCNQLITDSDSSNDESAKDIADQINNGIMLASGTIPLTTPGIIYKDADDQIAETSNLPAEFLLEHSYPNPFNPICEIAYTLPRDCQVTLGIYNILGQKVRVLVDEHQSAGDKSVKWDGKDDQGKEVTSGIYFYRIQAADFVQSKKMILMK